MKIYEIIKSRYFLIALGVLIFSIAFTLKLYSMQIIEGEKYKSQSMVRIYHEIAIEASRGSIYDRNGIPLAVNRECTDVYLRKAFNNSKELNASLLVLYNILEDNDENFNKSLQNYITIMPFQFSEKISEEEMENWQTSSDLFKISKRDVYTDPFYFFNFLKTFFFISDEYTIEEAYKIMTLRYEILKMRWQYLTGEGIRIANDISMDTIAKISEQTHYLQGVIVRTRMVRTYTDVYNIGHVLGYIGPVTGNDIKRDSTYSQFDMIGKTGIEAYAEEYLRGIRGNVKVETDTSGRIITEIGGEKAVNGKDIYLTIDMNLQKVAMESLEKNIKHISSMYDGVRHFGDANAGAAVVIDVKTGEVLAMASYPSYDPSWFINSDSESMEKRAEVLLDSERTPMFNRAIQALYTPGSTYKPIVGIAGLEKGIITGTSTITCTGHEVIGDWDFYCLTYRLYGWSHGPLNLRKAMETSCNLYFYKLGVQTGIDDIDYWAQQFGLGELTGIDLYGEQKGIRSNREYKYNTFDDRWWIADTAQSSIGQLYNSFTPLQMANFTGTIANGGKLFTPHVIMDVKTQAGVLVKSTDKKYSEVPWSDTTFNIVIDSLRGVVLDGTAQRVFENFPINVAGKTGTAETGRANQSSNALFVGYAPMEDPQIAVAVVIEKGVWGSYVAPVARDIMEAYFNLSRD